MLSHGDAHLVSAQLVSVNAQVSLIAQLILHSDARTVLALPILSSAEATRLPHTYLRSSLLPSPQPSHRSSHSFTRVILLLSSLISRSQRVLSSHQFNPSRITRLTLMSYSRYSQLLRARLLSFLTSSLDHTLILILPRSSSHSLRVSSSSTRLLDHQSSTSAQLVDTLMRTIDPHLFSILPSRVLSTSSTTTSSTSALLELT